MKTKHTPGKWEIDGDLIVGPEYTDPIINESFKPQIARIIPGPYSEWDKSLIASAPELLATLRKIGVWLIAPRTDVQTIAEMNTLVSKAIAKAEGREQ